MTQELRKLAEAAKVWLIRPLIVQETEDDILKLGETSEDGEFYELIEIDCENYGHPSRPLAEFIAAANPAAILALLDRLEKAEKDAERYRWLRDTGTQGFSNGVPQRGVTIAMDGSVKLHFVYWMTQQQLDKSIDEAMEASK